MMIQIIYIIASFGRPGYLEDTQVKIRVRML